MIEEETKETKLLRLLLVQSRIILRGSQTVPHFPWKSSVAPERPPQLAKDCHLLGPRARSLEPLTPNHDGLALRHV